MAYKIDEEKVEWGDSEQPSGQEGIDAIWEDLGGEGYEPTDVMELLEVWETPLSNPLYHMVFNDDYRVIHNALQAVWSPLHEDTKSWPQFWEKVPKEKIASFMDRMNKSTWEKMYGNKKWDEDLSGGERENLIDRTRKILSLGSSVFLDMGGALGTIKFFGLTNDGLTALKLQNIAPYLDDADDLTDFQKTLRRFNIDPSSPMGQDAIKIFKTPDIDFKLGDSVEEAIRQTKRSGISIKGGKPLKLPGKLGELQTTAEAKVGEVIDSLRAKLKGMDEFSDLGTTDPRLSQNMADTFKSGDRITRKLIDDAVDYAKNFNNTIENISNTTDFTKNEIFELADMKTSKLMNMDTFRGKKVTNNLADQIDTLREPLRKIEDTLRRSDAIDFNPRQGMFEERPYLPRKTTKSAKEAMEESVPEWYQKYYDDAAVTGGASELYNTSLQKRIFDGYDRAYINELSNQGKLGVVSSPDGKMLEVGNVDELAQKYPQEASRNLIKNLTGGKKVDFYEQYSPETINDYFQSVAKTEGGLGTYKKVINRGMASGDIIARPTGKAPSGYVEMQKGEAGNLQPLFEDILMKPEIKAQIKGIMETKGTTKYKYVTNAWKNLQNNFKKVAIGVNTEYPLRNYSGNLLRSWTDPTRTPGQWFAGQALGHGTTAAKSRIGQKLGLDELFNRMDLKLPTGETTTPRKLQDEFLETGGLSSGYRGNVVRDSNIKPLQEIGQEASARLQSGENIGSNILKTGSDLWDKLLDTASWAGLQSREKIFEPITRSGDYMASRLSGYTPESAQNRQFLNEIDYADFGPLVDTIQDWAYPFLKYQLKAKPLLLERLLTSPGKFRWIQKYRDYKETFGTDLTEEEIRRIKKEKPPEKWMKIPYLDRIDEDGNPVYKDINRALGGILDYIPDPIKSMTRDDVSMGSQIQQAGEGLVGGAHPGLKTPFELVSGTDMFTQRDIPEVGIIGDVGMPGWLQQVIGNFVPVDTTINKFTDDEAELTFGELFSPVSEGTTYITPEQRRKLDISDTVENIKGQYIRTEDEQKREILKKSFDNLRETGKPFSLDQPFLFPDWAEEDEEEKYKIDEEKIEW